MGQCGCGEQNIEKAIGLGKRLVVGIKTYDGCSDCFQGIAVDLSFFDRRKSEWLHGLKIEDIKPDEYGGNQGNGLPIPLLDVDSLRAAAKEIDMQGSLEEYEGEIDDWLQDEGLNLIQAARRHFDKKHARELEELASRIASHTPDAGN